MERVCFLRFAKPECAQSGIASSRDARGVIVFAADGKENHSAVAANRRNFRKLSCLRVDSVDPANVLSGRENIQRGQRDREAERLAASGQPHRPVRRAFRFFCTTFTCFLLLISTLPTPSTAGSTLKVLRYGTQKTAGYPSALHDMECRKREVADKIIPLERSGLDLDCLAPETALDGRNGNAGVAPMLPSVRSGSGGVETPGARAPPLHFA